MNPRMLRVPFKGLNSIFYPKVHNFPNDPVVKSILNVESETSSLNLFICKLRFSSKIMNYMQNLYNFVAEVFFSTIGVKNLLMKLLHPFDVKWKILICRCVEFSFRNFYLHFNVLFWILKLFYLNFSNEYQ